MATRGHPGSADAIFLPRHQLSHMTRPARAVLVSLAALACGGGPFGPGTPAATYEVMVTPRDPKAATSRFVGTKAEHVGARIPIDSRQTIWRAKLSIRLMNKTGALVGVMDLVFPDTTLRYGQIELERGRLGPFPDRLVATGYVVRPDGMGLYQITSGQLQLAKGAEGVLQGSFTAELSPVVPADATAEVVADAAGRFVARRLTW